MNDRYRSPESQRELQAEFDQIRDTAYDLLDALTGSEIPIHLPHQKESVKLVRELLSYLPPYSRLEREQERRENHEGVAFPHNKNT